MQTQCLHPERVKLVTVNLLLDCKLSRHYSMGQKTLQIRTSLNSERFFMIRG